MRRSQQDVQRLRAASHVRSDEGQPADLIRSVSKSIWKERHSRNFSFFCPFCTTPRRLGLHPRLGHPIHFIQVGLCSGVFTLLAWPFFGWKGMVSFVPLWTIFEVFYRAKVRASVICTSCGFDPVLYLVDSEKAKQGIREHYEKKRIARQSSLGEQPGLEVIESTTEITASGEPSEEAELTQ